MSRYYWYGEKAYVNLLLPASYYSGTGNPAARKSYFYKKLHGGAGFKKNMTVVFKFLQLLQKAK